MFVVRRIDRVVLDESRTDNLALVEETDQTGEFVLIQASLDEEDEQDADLGIDGPCIVRPDGQVAYHAVTSYRLTRSSLALAFTSAAADALELSDRVELSLDLPDEDFDRLSVGLGEMLPEVVAENA